MRSSLLVRCILFLRASRLLLGPGNHLVVPRDCQSQSDRVQAFRSLLFGGIVNEFFLLFPPIGSLKVRVVSSSQVHQETVSLEEYSVAAPCHDVSDFASSFDSPQFQEGRLLGESITEKGSGLSFTRSLDDRGSLVLEGLLDEILSAFGLLLRDLLLFDSLGEFRAEVQVSDGYVVKHDVEVP